MAPRSLAAFLCALCTWAAAQAQQPPNFLPDPLPQPTPVPAPELPLPLAEPPGPCLPACPPPVADKNYCATNVHLVEVQTLEERPNYALREVIAQIPTCDVEVTYREEKRTVTVMVLKPREEEQTVTGTTVVPETVIDPCTGCPHTTYTQVPVCKTVKVTVYDQVPETQTYTVKVPVVRPVQKEVQIRHYILDTTPKPTVVRHYEAVVLPVDLHYQIPVCPSPIPLAPAPEGPRQPESPPTIEAAPR